MRMLDVPACFSAVSVTTSAFAPIESGSQLRGSCAADGLSMPALAINCLVAVDLQPAQMRLARIAAVMTCRAVFMFLLRWLAREQFVRARGERGKV
jgi:hypothetical protein